MSIVKTIVFWFFQDIFFEYLKPFTLYFEFFLFDIVFTEWNAYKRKYILLQNQPRIIGKF